MRYDDPGRGRRRGWRSSARWPGRRLLVWVSAALAVMLLAASCGSGDGDGQGGEEGPVSIRFFWWGSDERAKLTEQAIAAFEKKFPDVDVKGEYIEWGEYWDRLATATSAGDMPDVLMQEERFLREYASRGALMDLSEQEDIIDTSNLDPLVLDTGRVEDGLYALASGVNAFGVLANPKMFQDLGVQIPDDSKWTWEDYIKTAVALTKASGGKIYGTTDYGVDEAGLKIFARQHGESFYTDDGEVDLSPQTVAQWWEYSVQLRDQGGTPPADVTVEAQQTSGPEASLLGTKKAAMSWFWSNQLGAAAEAVGNELVMLRPPGETQFQERGHFLKPAMAYAISSQTEQPEAAARFVNFMLNDPAAIDVIGSDRGLPANLEQRERIMADLEADKVAEAEFITEVADEIENPLPTPPTGAGATVDLLTRINEEVLFDRLTPAQAAEQFISELKAETGGG
jgi:multiple sugar transport system substrate-binding protein